MNLIYKPFQSTLKSDWISKVGDVRTGSEKEIDTLTNNIQNKINSVDWSSVGANMIEGMTEGVKSKAVDLTVATTGAATQALKAVTDKLEIKSPS